MAGIPVDHAKILDQLQTTMCISKDTQRAIEASECSQCVVIEVPNESIGVCSSTSHSHNKVKYCDHFIVACQM